MRFWMVSEQADKQQWHQVEKQAIDVSNSRKQENERTITLHCWLSRKCFCRARDASWVMSELKLPRSKGQNQIGYCKRNRRHSVSNPYFRSKLQTRTCVRPSAEHRAMLSCHWWCSRTNETVNEKRVDTRRARIKWEKRLNTVCDSHIETSYVRYG